MSEEVSVATTPHTSAATTAPASWFERRFSLHARNTTVRIELIAGVTSFLAAAYLLVVIPSLLATAGWTVAPPRHRPS